MFEISSVRHMYPEPAGFFINRPTGHRNYTFLHFHNRVELRLEGKLVQTEPHCMILFRPGTPQFFRSRVPLLHDWFHFAGDFSRLPLKLFTPDQIFYPSSHGFVTNLVAEMETEFFAKEESSLLLTDCKIKELFIGLDRDLGNRELGEVRSETLEKFRFLRGEMFSSLDRQHTVDALAARINLSPSRFFALYKKIYGTSPVADLIIARIRSAENKLAYSEESVDAIAASLAYENTTHFIRQFKSRTGLTPSAYRKQVRGGEK